jgi:hypothetical protein
LTPQELREAYLIVVSRSAKRLKPDPTQFVPELVAVYAALGEAEGISQRERTRMRATVKARLEDLRDRLMREQRKTSRTAQLASTESRTRTAGETPPTVAGGPELANANELIELIQITIEPEHWDINGGPGSIYYFPMVHALVVRARSDIHEDIGGVLGQVRRLNQ